MKAKISKISKSQISHWLKGLDVTDGERATFDRCLGQSTTIWVGMFDEELACAWGLIPPTLLSDTAYLWLYTSPALHGHEFLFVRHSQRALEEVQKVHPVIVGVTQIGADKTIRWLKWLGAEFGDHEGTKLPFTIRKK